ncbi:hypothetical protein HYH02_000696 [Chlamydomonas schloesseri]|uniref:Uncharacterized protein n=1 Tax=Chlamydomonas schloesseri TaxID=2026947 RepID=A0A836BDP6_9CHLO|nr:hypothetical protein HYH02_000696 [Chlamydomonas schloesseri]|eukprot:KAG2454865.1 hypothetical protein HYH02_000696 [Chlamydomonas schloesseri]
MQAASVTPSALHPTASATTSSGGAGQTAASSVDMATSRRQDVPRGSSGPAATRGEIPKPPAKRASDGGFSCGAEDLSFLPRRAASGGGGFPAAPAGAAASSYSAGGYSHNHGHPAYIPHSPASPSQPQHRNLFEAGALRLPRRTVRAVRSAGGACPSPAHLVPGSTCSSPRAMPPSRLGPAVTAAAVAAAAAHYRRQESCPPPLAPFLFPQPDADARSGLYTSGGADSGAMLPPGAFLPHAGRFLDLAPAAAYGAMHGPSRFLSEPPINASSYLTSGSFAMPPPHPARGDLGHRLPATAPPPPLSQMSPIDSSMGGGTGGGPCGDGGGGVCACYECLAQHRRLPLARVPPSSRPTSAGAYRHGPASSGGGAAASSSLGPAAPAPAAHHQRHHQRLRPAAGGLLGAGAAPLLGPCTCAQCTMMVKAATGPLPGPTSHAAAALAASPTPFLTVAAAASAPMSSPDTDMSSDGDAVTSAEDVQYQTAYSAAYAAAYRAAYRAVRTAYVNSGGSAVPQASALVAATAVAAEMGAARGISAYRGTSSDYVPGTPSQHC